MKVDTVDIGYIPVDRPMRDILVAVLADCFHLSVVSESIMRFTEPTASSVIYRAICVDGLTVVIKTSIWVGPGPALEKVYAVSEALRAAGVPMAKTFRTKDGSFAGEADGQQYIVQTFESGEHFRARPEEFAAAGAALGLFHRAGDAYLKAHPADRLAIPELIPVEKPYQESRGLYVAGMRDTLLASHTCSAPLACAAFRDCVGDVERAMALIDASKVEAPERLSGLLHNDFHANNALFSATGQFNCFLDLDQIGVGPHVWDIGNTLASFAANAVARHPAVDFEPLARAFLVAYHAEHPLAGEEYLLIVAASQRWDVMRILRSLRRHHFENDRLPGLLHAFADRLIRDLTRFPTLMAFLTPAWVDGQLRNIKA